ncbi:hypothetical protein AB0M45_10120 [Nocardia sp. NPDC051787]|uniref:hypothetical protein n=1 Tax=Nocardia sp. NPDC051787 TaxID=3155415 RepID=UPI0034424D38
MSDAESSAAVPVRSSSVCPDAPVASSVSAKFCAAPQRMATTYTTQTALVNGAAGLVSTLDGVLMSVMSFTVVAGRIAEIDILADPDRLARLDVATITASQ